MQGAQPTAPAQRPRGGRPRYWLRRLVALLLLLLPVAAWKGWALYHQAGGPGAGAWGQLVPVETTAPRVDASQEVYVLVLGVDERKQDVGRSDTLLLVRLKPKGAGADVISIPRDTRAQFPNGQSAKINAAYPTGGPEMATQVVADLLGIPQPYYVKVNLEAFERIVDKLGGVDLTVDRHYQYSDPYQKLEIDIQSGEQHMDGATALKYVRIRYDGVTNDDIARIKRQQQFMSALTGKLSSPSTWWKIPDLIATTRKYVATNIPEGDQLDLAQSLFKARSSLSMQTLPGTPDDSNGDWVIDRDRWNGVKQAWSQK